MVINNIFAILTQIMCFIIYFIIASFLRDFTIGGGILSIVIWVIYLYIGTKLTSQGSNIKNLLSVSFIGILGIITFILGSIVESTRIFLQELFAIFVIPNFGIVLLFPDYIFKNNVISILISLIAFFSPSTLMWLGLQWKARSLKQKQSL